MQVSMMKHGRGLDKTQLPRVDRSLAEGLSQTLVTRGTRRNGDKIQLQATSAHSFKIVPGVRAKGFDPPMNSCTPAAAVFWKEHVGPWPRGLEFRPARA